MKSFEKKIVFTLSALFLGTISITPSLARKVEFSATQVVNTPGCGCYITIRNIGGSDQKLKVTGGIKGDGASGFSFSSTPVCSPACPPDLSGYITLPDGKAVNYFLSGSDCRTIGTLFECHGTVDVSSTRGAVIGSGTMQLNTNMTGDGRFSEIVINGGRPF